MHIDIHRLEGRYLQQGIDPRTIQQAGDIKDDGTCIEGQQVGVFHQRSAPPQELFADLLRRLLMPSGKEPLEFRRAPLLASAIVGIIEVEHSCKKMTLWELFIDSTLLPVVVEFATRLTQQEIEMYLTIIVG